MAAAGERLGDTYDIVYDIVNRDGIGLTLEQAVAEARLHVRA